MKKILLLCLLLPCFAFAQKHMEFMGVELGGDLDETIAIFKSKGFVEDEYGKNKGLGLYGKYWKFDKIHVFFYSPDDTNKVIEVSLTIENQLFYTDELLSNLDEKYGKHTLKTTLINKEYYWEVEGGSRIVLERYKSLIIIKYQDYPKTAQEKSQEKERNKDL